MKERVKNLLWVMAFVLCLLAGVFIGKALEHTNLDGTIGDWCIPACCVVVMGVIIYALIKDKNRNE